MKVQFPKELMLSILLEDREEDDYEVIKNEISDTSRWSNIYDLIFKFQGKLYSSYYSVGATEQQDESPWEYDDQVECWEVEEYQKTITDYRAIKP